MASSMESASHLLRFADAGIGRQTQVDAIREAYHLRGWKHVVSSVNSGGPMHDNKTDVWVVMDGANLRGAVVFVDTPRASRWQQWPET